MKKLKRKNVGSFMIGIFPFKKAEGFNFLKTFRVPYVVWDIVKTF